MKMKFKESPKVWKKRIVGMLLVTVLSVAGLVETKEYENGNHPFISTPSPEMGASFTEEERTEFITEEQQALAVRAEQDIKEWLVENIYYK